jgi:hypothetical protein
MIARLPPCRSTTASTKEKCVQTFRLSVPAEEVRRRMRERLCPAASTATKVVWQHRGDRILLHTDGLQAQMLDGWIVCDLPVQTDQTGRQSLQFVYYVGTTTEADGLQAAGTVNAPNAEASRLADALGAHIERVLWDGVLDCLEGALAHVAKQFGGQKLTLAGYHCRGATAGTPAALSADVVVGDI